MAFTCRYGGGTAINRTSWAPMSTTHVDLSPKAYNRPLSGNFDRIINAFDKTNAFQYVRNNEKDEIFDKIEEKAGAQEERFVAHGDLVVNRKMSSSYERAGGNLATQTPCCEEDVGEMYQERIMYSQARQLFPLQEDLADWINKTIGITYLTGDNFLDALDNGVELCQLAAVVVEKARETVQRGLAPGPVPHINGRCWQRAARRSFFSRDNMENFIMFCRQLGVHENLLFESDDLVLHNQPRQVILCLLEVARLVAKYDIEPPGLVQLEKEIALEERDSGIDSALSGLGWQFRDASPVDDGNKKETPSSPAPVCEAAPECQHEAAVSEAGSADSDVPLKPTNELDKRVQIVSRLLERRCNCSEGKCSKLLKVKKVGEGRYNIAGRNVFIRLLKGRHMMVRVGGGWDTLEHFLSRHDPCQVRLVSQSKHRTDITTLHLSSAPPPGDTRTDSQHSLELSPIRGASPDRATRTPSEGSASPECDNRRTSTPTKPIKTLKQSLTLPLGSAIDKGNVRKQSAPSISNPGTLVSPRSTPGKGRSMSLASVQSRDIKSGGEKYQRRPSSLASTPIDERKCFQAGKTPPRVKTARSLSLASTPVAEKTFEGEALQYGKKTRSMSLATPTNHKPALYRNVSAKSITPAEIEESIRNSITAKMNTCGKPFLHIKAKYRSPPPREVPPR